MKSRQSDRWVSISPHSDQTPTPTDRILEAIGWGRYDVCHHQDRSPLPPYQGETLLSSPSPQNSSVQCFAPTPRHTDPDNRRCDRPLRTASISLSSST